MTKQAARSCERSGYAFVLGAGFSKSVDPRMPTTTELLELLKHAAVDEGWPFAVESGIERFDDLESWLDSVAISQPYRSDSEDTPEPAQYPVRAHTTRRCHIAQVP